MQHGRLTMVGVIAATIAIVAGTAIEAWAGSTQAEDPAAGRDGQLAYVVMDGSDSIAVIDLAQRAVVDRIAVKGNPHGGAITPDGRFIYTASMGSKAIYVVDTGQRKTVDSIEVGSISHHAVASADGRYVYTAADKVVVIDTANNRVVARIATAEPPFFLAFSPGGERLYALGVGSTIAVIDPATRRVVETIDMNATSVMGHLAVRPDGKELYVTNDSDDAVTVIDTDRDRPVAHIPVGKGPHGVTATADGRFVIVANRGQSDISVIDTRSKAVVATREVGRRPEHLTTSPDGRSVLMSMNTGSNKVLIIDPASFATVATIDVWSAPHQILLSGSVADDAALRRPAASAADLAGRAM